MNFVLQIRYKKNQQSLLVKQEDVEYYILLPIKWDKSKSGDKDAQQGDLNQI